MMLWRAGAWFLATTAEKVRHERLFRRKPCEQVKISCLPRQINDLQTRKSSSHPHLVHAEHERRCTGLTAIVAAGPVIARAGAVARNAAVTVDRIFAVSGTVVIVGGVERVLDVPAVGVVVV